MSALGALGALGDYESSDDDECASPSVKATRIASEKSSLTKSESKESLKCSSITQKKKCFSSNVLENAKKDVIPSTKTITKTRAKSHQRSTSRGGFSVALSIAGKSWEQQDDESDSDSEWERNLSALSKKRTMQENVKSDGDDFEDGEDASTSVRRGLLGVLPNPKHSKTRSSMKISRKRPRCEQEPSSLSKKETKKKKPPSPSSTNITRELKTYPRASSMALPEDAKESTRVIHQVAPEKLSSSQWETVDSHSSNDESAQPKSSFSWGSTRASTSTALVRAVDPKSGRAYLYNPKTGVSTWESETAVQSSYNEGVTGAVDDADVSDLDHRRRHREMEAKLRRGDLSTSSTAPPGVTIRDFSQDDNLHDQVRLLEKSIFLELFFFLFHFTKSIACLLSVVFSFSYFF